MKHLFLIGMPGCGKSYLAHHVSGLLHRPCIDLDDYIQSLHGQSIAELFAAGEAEFRKKEHAALVQMMATLKEPSVLAMGGGTPVFYDNITIMKAHGGLLWVDISIPELIDNLLKQPAQRPLLANLPVPELAAKLEELYQKRYPYYQQATWKINTTTKASLDIFVNQFNEFLLQDHG